MYGKHKGFTIVELLIVIVVIAILAAISVVSYTGIQARANDARIRSAASQLERAILAWSASTGNTTIMGGIGSNVGPSSAGCVNGTNGWFAKFYTCTAQDHLVAQGVISANFTEDLPRNKHYDPSTSGRALMLYKCTGTPGKYSLFWTLEQPTAEETANLDSVVTTCGNTLVRDTWGMRAGKIFTLPS